MYISPNKILTSIRVATHQKKIDIDVPKLSNFVHNVYIKCARKFYSSVYIFETNIKPLEHQKNMRECEMICKECILNTVRESMPIEKILRAYMDETTEEEIVEEEINEQVKEEKKEEEEDKNAISDEVKSEIKKVADAIKNKEEVKSEEVKSEENIKLVIEDTIKDLEEKIETNNSTEEKSEPLAIQVETEKAPPKRESIKFNDVDSVINYDTKESPKIHCRHQKMFQHQKQLTD